MPDSKIATQWVSGLSVSQVKAILQKLGRCAQDIGNTAPHDALLECCTTLESTASEEIAKEGVLNYVKWMCGGTWVQFDEDQWKHGSILHDNYTVVEHWAFKLLAGSHIPEMLCDLQPFLIDAPFQSLAALKTDSLIHQRRYDQFNHQTGYLEFAALQISLAPAAWSQEVCIAAAAIFAFRSEVGPFTAKGALYVWAQVCALLKKVTFPWKHQAGIVALLLILLQDKSFYSVAVIAKFLEQPTQGICVQCNELLRAHQKHVTSQRALSWGEYILDKPDDVLRLIEEKKQRQHKKRDASPARH